MKRLLTLFLMSLTALSLAAMPDSPEKDGKPAKDRQKITLLFGNKTETRKALLQQRDSLLRANALLQMQLDSLWMANETLAMEDVASGAGDTAACGFIETTGLDQFTPTDTVPVTIDSVKFQQKLYMAPLAMECIALFRNKDLMPQRPQTVPQLIAQAQKIQRQSQGKVRGFYFEIKDLYFSLPFLTAEGAYLLGRDAQGNYVPTDVGIATPGAVRGAEFLRDLVQKDKLIQLGATENISRTIFLENQAAVILNGPWFLKPRSEAGSIGIKKIEHPQELWDLIHQLGDEQSHKLLEEYVPGQVYHVDSIIWDRQVLFSQVSRYVRPPFDIWNYGGVFCTRTLPHGYEEEPQIEQMNGRVIKAMGLVRGVTHAEFIRSATDGNIYFLEIAARVGGASIDVMVEAATGLNMWEEWARLEVAYARGEEYHLPQQRHDNGALLVSLSRQAAPDTSQFNDPEVWWRMTKDHHVGLVLESPSFERLSYLIDDYIPRMQRDFMAIEPPATSALT